jgi:hypothetical protein
VLTICLGIVQAKVRWVLDRSLEVFWVFLRPDELCIHNLVVGRIVFRFVLCVASYQLIFLVNYLELTVIAFSHCTRWVSLLVSLGQYLHEFRDLRITLLRNYCILNALNILKDFEWRIHILTRLLLVIYVPSGQVNKAQSLIFVI